LHGELDFVTLGFQRAEGELCGGDVESVEGEFVAGVMVVEGLRGVDEPDPMQLSVVSFTPWSLGLGGQLPCSCGYVCYGADICRRDRGMDGCAADDVHEEGMLCVETIDVSDSSLYQPV
jgi:hypothetical protein